MFMINSGLLEYLAHFGIKKHFIDIVIHNFHHFLATQLDILTFLGQWPLAVTKGQI